MLYGDALGEVYHCYFAATVVHHQIELVVIAMNETVFGEVYQVLDAGFEQGLYLFLGSYAGYLAESIPVDQGHQDSVAVGVDWSWNWKFVLVKQLHEEELSD